MGAGTIAIEGAITHVANGFRLLGERVEVLRVVLLDCGDSAGELVSGGEVELRRRGLDHVWIV